MSMIWMFDVRRAVMPHDDNTKRKSVAMLPEFIGRWTPTTSMSLAGCLRNGLFCTLRCVDLY